ncbi:MAG: Lar family restriction alleviation protein [Oscillospiraceae bacterium]|nr:Lar family restriction alleviation protein [Oscillospiraceae bacterium]
MMRISTGKKNEHTEIADCPFCGGKGKIKRVDKPYVHGWVGCPACRAYVIWTRSDRAARSIWNRTTMTAKCEQMKLLQIPKV